MSQPNLPDQIDQEVLKEIYAWVDTFELSRPKKNISRDFSDGVLVAEILHRYHPGFVQLHNYSAANDQKQKRMNWTVLRDKVTKKIGFKLSEAEVDDLINCKPFAVEALLVRLKAKLEAPQTSPVQIQIPLFTAPQRNVNAAVPPEEGAVVDLGFLKQVLLGDNLKEVLLKGRKENLLDHDPLEDDPELKEVYKLNDKISALETRMNELRAVLASRNRTIIELENEFIAKNGG